MNIYLKCKKVQSFTLRRYCGLGKCKSMIWNEQTNICGLQVIWELKSCIGSKNQIAFYIIKWTKRSAVKRMIINIKIIIFTCTDQHYGLHTNTH